MIQGKSYTLHIGNNLDILPTLPDNSVNSIVTDPPYELGFMGKFAHSVKSFRQVYQAVMRYHNVIYVPAIASLLLYELLKDPVHLGFTCGRRVDKTLSKTCQLLQALR